LAALQRVKISFGNIYNTAQKIPSEWFCLNLPASVSKLLPEGELEAAKAQLSPDQYMQEYDV